MPVTILMISSFVKDCSLFLRKDRTYVSVVYTNLLSENGVIEFNEFLYLMAEIALDGDSEAELLEVFRILDRDNDG